MAEDTSQKHLHPRAASENEAAHPAFPTESHGISINLPPGAQDGRPHPVKHMSAPAYQSPIRHHRRTPSRSKGVKETLNARSHYGSSDDDGASVHRINQYIIKQEIGRGSFGAVHLAADQYGNEYAVKEFSKSRLRKRAQSNLLRKPNPTRRPGHLAAGLGFNSPLHRVSSSDKLKQPEENNSLSLIKEEIAIMKKLNHNNLVALIEVLDDPQEDSLYMVLEMCKKGVAMKVGLDERAEPYDDETCRCWFRDMILGIEYLHAQGIIHRDIKPDNCLITNEDVLKIVDFGVSEMFEKDTEMATAKSAGSPAFMPPELCVARHGQVSGRAADIWSMGVTLYCLRYGHIPFEKSSMIELYDSIRGDDFPIDGEKDTNFQDVMRRILDKDPETRITMEQLRDHPWVTKDGTDPLLSAEENCSDLIEPPTEAEMNNAITGNMAHLLTVMRAVKRFKKIVHDKRGQVMEGIFGRESRLVAPPNSIRPHAKSVDTHDRKPLEKSLTTGGVHRPIDVNDDVQKLPRNMDKAALHQSPQPTDQTPDVEKTAGETQAHYLQRMEAAKHHPVVSSQPAMHRRATLTHSRTLSPDDHAKGHAHDPLEDRLFLSIGFDPDSPQGHGDAEHPIVSESPPAVDENIYEQAYQDEMRRVLQHRGKDASLYMTRRIEHRDDIRSHDNIVDAGKHAARSAAARLQAMSTKDGDPTGDKGGASKMAALKAVGNLASGSSKLSEDEAQQAAAAGREAAQNDAAMSAAKSAFAGLKSKSSGFSDLVKRAQARTGEVESEKSSAEQPEHGSSAAVSAEPKTTDGAAEETNVGAKPQEQPRTHAVDPAEPLGDSAPSMPGAFPATPAAEETPS